MKGELINIAGMLYNTPLMVLPSYAETVMSVLSSRMGVEPLAAVPVVQPRTAREAMITQDGIFVLPVVGGLYHRGGMFDASSGAQSYTNLHNTLRSVVNEGQARGILLDIDSPGGAVHGCFELGAVIKELSRKMPIRAIANGMCASAAYAIASSCDHVYATPSSDVGSIGVITMHRDISKAAADAGVKITMIYAGKHKADGNPYEKLPDNVRAGIQDRIDAAYLTFVEHVADARGLAKHKVRATEAGMFSAADAVESGLVDQVASFDAALAHFAASFSKPRSSQPKRTSTMSNTNASADAAPTSEAIARAFNDGVAAGKATNAQAVADAHAAGRAEAASILEHEACQGRAAAAVGLIRNAKLSKDEVTGLLATLPKADEGGSAFKDRLHANSPVVRSEATPAHQPAQEGFMSGVVGMLNAR